MHARKWTRSLWRLWIGVGVALCAAVSVRTARAQGADTLSLYADAPRWAGRPTDPNGFLFNPGWLGAPPPRPGERSSPPAIERRCGFRVATGDLEVRTLLTTRGPCLSDDERDLVTLDETASTLGIGLVCNTNSEIGHVRGHINWFPVTATGQLAWADYSREPGDGDLSFDFGNTPEPAALTDGNPRPAVLGGRPAYHVEFNYSETLRRLTDSTDRATLWWATYRDSLRRIAPDAREEESWWVALHDVLVDTDAMHALIDRRFAIVTGVFGLDGVHDFQAEMHPVLAMAVLLDTTRSGTRLREQWALLVRNLGNDGDCASGTLPLVTSDDSLQDYAVDLGWWRGAGAPRVYLGPAWSTDAARVPTAVGDAAGGHLLIRLRHPSPGVGEPDFTFLGTVFVEWSRDGAGAALDRLYDLGRKWLESPSVALALDALAPPPETRALRPPPTEHPGKLAVVEPGRVVLRRAPGPDSLELVAPRVLELTEAPWSNPASVRADRTLPWVQAEPVLIGCGAGQIDPLCRNPYQLMSFGVNPTQGTLFVSPLYVYARAFTICPHDCAVDHVVGAFAYRFDIAGDHFGRDSGQTLRGWSARLSPILAPSSVRLGSAAVLTPYNVFSVGFSHLEGASDGVLFAVGFGLRAHTFAGDAFLEVHDVLRPGGFQNHWDFIEEVHLDFGTLWKTIRGRP